MTPDEEKYVHLESCSDDLNDVWRVFQDIKENRGNPLVGPAFRYALIAYARPYVASRGEHSSRYQLDERFIPSPFYGLHQRLVAARHQIHAHSDLTVRDATVHISKIPEGRWVGTVQRTIRGTEELEHLEDILAMVEGTLVAMYAEIQVLKERLPFNS